MIYKQSKAGSRFYYLVGDPDKWVQSQEEWKQFDSDTKFVAWNVETSQEYGTVSNRGSNLSVSYNLDTGKLGSVKPEFISPAGQVTGQPQDKTRQHGELSNAFDAFLSENRETHWKRDVAEWIGTTYKDESFQKVVHRAYQAGKIKFSHGGDKIRWVNKDWKFCEVDPNAGEKAFLDLKLPFGAEKYILVPEHSQITLGGDIGSGKTHYSYLLADLNVGKIPIRHFFNEGGEGKAVRLLDDYPLLREHLGKDYHLIDLDKEELDVAESLDPDGLNIYDYLHAPANKEWFLWLPQELAKYSKKLGKGVIAVMMQKLKGKDTPFGGEGTKMQCEIQFLLHIIKDVEGDDAQHGYKECRIDIVKAKDWASNRNPENQSLIYRTFPKYGQLKGIGQGWSVMERTYQRKDNAKQS